MERIGANELPLLERYLRSYYHENILVLSDLAQTDASADPRRDTLSLVGYRHEGELIAVQGFYRYGRWFPHFLNDIAIGPMLDDMLERRVRWVMGVRRVVDPILRQLEGLGFETSYDEKDYLCYVDRQTFRPYELEGVRRATREDASALAALRCDFESDYFGTPCGSVDHAWCLWMARRYIERGAFVAERDGHLVSMVAAEAVIPELSQIAAVYTIKGYRGRGLAKGVVSAICKDQLLDRPRVTLTVKTDNVPAFRVYRALGFCRWTDYRMSRFA